MARSSLLTASWRRNLLRWATQVDDAFGTVSGHSHNGTDSRTLSATGNTLDQSYDQGGVGAGRAITVNDGAITMTKNDAGTENVLEISASPSAGAAGAGAGAGAFNPAIFDVADAALGAEFLGGTGAAAGAGAGLTEGSIWGEPIPQEPFNLETWMSGSSGLPSLPYIPPLPPSSGADPSLYGVEGMPPGVGMDAGAVAAALSLPDFLPGGKYASLTGASLSTLLSLISSGKQTGALTDIANQQIGQRAPFLAKATGYLNDPGSFYGSTEGGAAMEAILRRLSPQGGVSDPYKQALATGALYDRYGSTVGMLGNLGLSGQSGIVSPQMAAVGAEGRGLTDIGGFLGEAFNPKPQQMSLADLMKLVNLTVGGERV